MASYLDKTGLARFWSAIKKYISDAISGKADSEDVVQSDWDENDSKKNSYVQNRTHYRTSLGYTTDVDFVDGLGINLAELAEDTYEIPQISKTYTHASNSGDSTYWFLPDCVGTNFFPTGTLDDIDVHATSTTVTLNGTEETLSIYIDDSDSDNLLILYYSDDICIVITTDYGNGLYVLEPVYTTLLKITSLILTIPLTNEVFAYSKLLDSNYLDGSLIGSGSGEKSEIFNGVEGKSAAGQNSHAEGSGDPTSVFLYLSGNAGETSYTAYAYLTQEYVDYLQLFSDRFVFYYNGINTGIALISYEIQSYDHATEKVDILVKTNETLSEEEDITDKEYSILLPGLLALGHASHAEGSNTSASGTASHAEGYSTTASGSFSHAEGGKTTASGAYSHAEAYYTTASGSNSHAEGQVTTASGSNSHAEGSSTTASGQYSHAEGSNTSASGTASHVEGYSATASGQYSHAEGYGTTASGHQSHAEGYYTAASGNQSHAEGCYTTASGAYSHAEGYSIIRTNFNYYLTLTGDAGATTYTCEATVALPLPPSSLVGAVIGKSADSTVTITECTVNSRGQIASVGVSASLNTSSALSREVYYIYWLNHNVSGGTASHVEGMHVRAKGNASHAEGTYTYTLGENSHAEGLSTAALAANQHVQGKYNIEDSAGIYADIVGNGSGAGARSNAYTLDWSGNGVFAGKVTVGAAPTNDMDVATKAYVDSQTSDGNGIMVVNFTQYYDESVDAYAWQCDKTFTEIYTHLSNGGYAYSIATDLDYSVYICSLESVDSNQVVFVSPNEYYSGDVHWFEFSISATDWATVEETVISIPTKTSQLTNDSGFVTTDTNTTYSLSMSGNVITLTPSSGQAQSITLPVYDGSVT